MALPSHRAPGEALVAWVGQRRASLPENYLTLSRAERLESLGVAATQSGRPVYLLEKDIWVVWALDGLSSSQFGEHLVLGGGTSLSKAYNIIRRLSKDIDCHLCKPAIDPEPGGVRRPPIIDQWESMPAMTRVKVEAMVKAIPSRSLVRWLDDVAGLLEREQPARKRGAPLSVARVFVSRVAAIWRTLGLSPGLAYDCFLHPADGDRISHGGRVESRFQR